MDTNTVLRATSAGALTATATLADFPLTPMVNDFYLHLIVPSAGGTSPTLNVTADFESSGNATLQQATIPQITAAGHYVCPLFCDHPDLSALSVILTVGGTSPDFGAVEVYLSTSRVS